MLLPKIFILISFLTNYLICNSVSANNTKNLTLLNKFEAKLYQGQIFYHDPVIKRIQRLEIALFGEFENKEIEIQKRILKIENEIYSKELTYLNKARSHSPKPQYPTNLQQRVNSQRLRMQEIRENRIYQKSLEEDRKVFSIVNPILQNLMRSSINAIF